MSERYDPYAEFESTTLANGMRLFVLKRPVPWTLVRFTTHVGAEDEPVGKEGIAHFVEHMVAKDRSQPDSIATRERLFRSIGLQNQGLATGDFSTYWNARLMPQADPDIVFGKIAEHWFEPLPESRFLAEQAVVEQEYHKRNPSSLIVDLHEEVFRLLDPKGRYSRVKDILGNPATIRALTFEDLAQFHQKYYQPMNLSIVSVGGLSLRDVETLLMNTPFSRPSSGEKSREIIRGKRQPKPIPEQHLWRTVRLSDHQSALALNESQALAEIRARIPELPRNIVVLLTELIQNELLDYIRGHRASSYGVSVQHVRLVTGGGMLTLSYPMINKDILPDLPRIQVDCLRRARKDRSAFEQAKLNHIESLECLDVNLQSLRSGAAADIIRYGRIRPVAEEIAEWRALSYESYRDAFKWLAPEYRHTLTVTR